MLIIKKITPNMKQFPGDKKILIVNPGPVYPVKAMNQMRTNNMLRVLSSDFEISLATPVDSEEIYEESMKYMNNYGGKFYSLGSVKPKNNIIKKRLSQIYEYAGYYLLGYDKEVLTYKRFTDKIINVIKENNFKTIISNYWEGSLFFRELNSEYFKILDPHYAVGENLEVFENKKITGFKKLIEKKRLKRNLKLEKEVVNLSDLTLPLSKRNIEEFKKIAPEKDALLIPDGNDLEFFSSFPLNPDSKTILFYGAMGSEQNRNAFFRFYNNIYPSLKKEFKDLKVLVVGANPPDKIKQLDDNINFTVTGFVKDVRPNLAKAWFCIIPLELGSGFRGRVIELMAMGIPVIGTHNALDSIGLRNETEGFISDNDLELVNYCILLLRNNDLRNLISRNASKFVNANYSLDATFGKLNNYLNKNFI